MIKIIKIITFTAVTVFTVHTWTNYFESRQAAYEQGAASGVHDEIVMHAEEEPNTAGDESANAPRAVLSPAFWQWEARGRLALIDSMLDDALLSRYRKDWETMALASEDIGTIARHVVAMQMDGYKMTGRYDAPKIVFTHLRGDANGLYVPKDKTIYLNMRMKWSDLPFERLMEVILHENMHHIMTQTALTIAPRDALHNDFIALGLAAYAHTSGLAQDTRDIYQANPQELVAWRTQRAARYAGIMDAGLSAWDMTTRTQEIRVLSRDLTGGETFPAQ